MEGDVRWEKKVEAYLLENKRDSLILVKKIAVSSWVRKNKDEYKRRIIKEK